MQRTHDLFCSAWYSTVCSLVCSMKFVLQTQTRRIEIDTDNIDRRSALADHRKRKRNHKLTPNLEY